MYFIHPVSSFHVYQLSIISSMHFINPALCYPHISTLHHLIHACTNPVSSHLHKYQLCTILSMFLSNPASFYPCIIHPAFKVSRQSDKNVAQKHHLHFHFHTSNLTAVLKTWQGHHSILLMNRQSMKCLPLCRAAHSNSLQRKLQS